jgi:hypothetical protein
MSDLALTIGVERDGLRDMLETVALARETDAEAAHDHRYAEAARNIRLIAATMHQVDDEVMLDVAVINKAGDGMASKLIAARLLAIGFELPPFGSAGEFFALFATMIEKARKRRLQ